MNCSAYIFGKLSSGYTQYPEDSSSYVLKTLYGHCKASTQMVIHRDGSLMHYCYIRKLENDKYIGLCVVINGYYLPVIGALFYLFENIIEKMATHGVVIHFSEDGTLTSSIAPLNIEEELESIIEKLRVEFEQFGQGAIVLPQTNYGIAKDSVKDHCISDDVQDIVRASYSYGYTYIYKDADFDTVRMNSYRGILRRLNEANKTLLKEKQELQAENKKILLQKKQFGYILILMIIILGCGIGIFLLNDNLKNAHADLEQATTTINNKDSTITRLNVQIQCIKTNWDEEKEARRKVEENYASFNNLLNEIQPFIVRSTSFSFNRGWLYFNYCGLRDETVTLQAKAFCSTESYGSSRSIHVREGENNDSIYLSCNLDGSKWYSFELLIGNKIIGGDRH